MRRCGIMVDGIMTNSMTQPLGLGRSFSQRIAAHQRACDTFRDLGQALGVRDLRVLGSFGLVEGPIDDQALLLPYGLGQSWAPFGLDYLCAYFCTSHHGTFIDAAAGIGLWTLGVAREEFVSCKAIEHEPEHLAYLTNNIKNNCPNGNVEIINAGITALDSLLPLAQLRTPIAVKLNSPRAIQGAAQLLEAADVAMLDFWPRHGSDRRIFNRCFTQAATATKDTQDLDWRDIHQIVVPPPPFEVIL